ncbi:hypothetical protein ANO11243_065470 [Dothideomycetidae sp. 11243]|nr:hypothetical protein ANO11243_065470 [fungal sp. No.11243]
MAKGAKDPKSKATTAAPSTPPPTPTTKIGPINNQYEMLLKLHAPHQFTFVDSVMLEEGVHAGHMALVLRPARPFQFMRLPEETKRDILRLALAPEGYLAGKILVATKNNVVASKNYAEGKKDRLGFMRVSKTVNQAAQSLVDDSNGRQLYLLSRPLLYGNHFKFDDTTTLMNFLSVRSLEVKAIFTNIEIATYKKSSSLAALQTLADCTNLRRVHISTGVNLNATPEKAAKAFLQDAGHFLRSMSNARGGVDAGVNVLRFGRSQRCFGVKESDGEIRAWNDEERDRFADLLKADLFK